MLLTEKTVTSDIDINKIINEESIIIYFQPIASIHQNKIAGYEALVRGINPTTKEIINPMILFEKARELGLANKLDFLCQQKALEAFSNINDHANLILFLNIDHSFIVNEIENNTLYHMTQFWNINPENIVLEINEQFCIDMHMVKSFALEYKSLGFMISIDDVGAGYSNLDRIAFLKPDIIKIDKALISNIHKHFYKQQVVKMIVMLAENIGSLVVAEGTEKIEEILTVFKYGTHFIQGFYLSRPYPPNQLNNMNCSKRVNNIIRHQKEHLNNELLKKQYYNEFIRDLFLEVKNKLLNVSLASIDDTLKIIIKNYSDIECAYIVDLFGTQKSSTIFGCKIDSISRKKLFSPHNKGDDVTLKNYYYNLKTTGQSIWISDEYLSLATGNKCTTISGYITIKGKSFILCLDIELHNFLYNVSLFDN